METEDEDPKPATGRTKRRSPENEPVEYRRILQGRERPILLTEAGTDLRKTLLADALTAVSEDLDTIATNLDLVDDAEALRVSVRISKLISRKVADGAKIIIREKNGKASQLVIEATDEGNQDG